MSDIVRSYGVNVHHHEVDGEAREPLTATRLEEVIIAAIEAELDAAPGTITAHASITSE